MEKTVVSHFLYSVLQAPHPNLSFCDQFAIRPTGFTTAAIIAHIQTVSTMLITIPYVIVVSLDFSKAFDTVRHSTFLEKMAQRDLPDNVYNWLVDFFSVHTHTARCTKVRDRRQSQLQPALSKGHRLDLHHT